MARHNVCNRPPTSGYRQTVSHAVVAADAEQQFSAPGPGDSFMAAASLRNFVNLMGPSFTSNVLLTSRTPRLAHCAIGASLHWSPQEAQD